MFRLIRDSATEADLAREVRGPDPYVWRLPDPHEARWRRWFRRSREAGRHLPPPRDEECWRTPTAAPLSPWQADDDVVRPCVLRP
ncbi:hypothetical protein GT039_29680 [Streptomyces sp. SID2955]|nr:hypothetical protein [Streptomyces sp. SID2955]